MLRHGFQIAALLAVLGLLTGAGLGQDKAVEKDKAEKDKGEKDAPEKDKGEKDKGEKTATPMKAPPPPPNPWVKVGQVTGTVRSFQESDRSLQLTVKTPELNLNSVNGLLNAQAELQRALYQPPQNRAQAIFNAQRSIAENQARLYTMRDTDVSVKLHDDVKFRISSPPPKFDEKGRLVTRYTPAQLKEMKGTDPSLPGYTAELSDVQNGQIVLVTLVQHKDKLRARPARPAVKGAKAPDNADADLLVEDYKPQASVVVIVASPVMPGN